mgnify:CR=1 FL=1
MFIKILFNVSFLVFICLSTAFAQNHETIDSLLEIVESDISDKVKVNIYVKIAWEYTSTDSINNKKYADKAISLAKKINYKEGEIDALYEVGWNSPLLAKKLI